MKLTRRGKQARPIFLLLALIGAGWTGHYLATHSPIYGTCYSTAEGQTCPLIGYKGKE